jgi:hypothetical protein
VAGEVLVPPRSIFEASPDAIFMEDALEDFTIHAKIAIVDVTLIETRYASLGVGPLRPALATSEERGTWRLHDASIDVTNARPGWLGLYPDRGTSTEKVLRATPLALEVSPTIGNTPAPGDDEEQEHGYYQKPLQGPIITRSVDAWTYTGGGLLRIAGPSVTLHARENTTTIQTGQFEDPEAPGQITRRWLSIRYGDGEIAAEGGSTLIASSTMVAAWDGEARFASANGTIVSSRQTWTSAGGPHEIDGNFTARIAPANEPRGFVMTLTGDLRATTMTMLTPASPGPSIGPAWLILVAVVAGAAACGAGIAYARRRHTHPALHPEDYARLADEAADAEDYSRAAELAAEGRKRSPTSRRLALDHAFFTGQAGELDAAIRLLDDPLLRTDPDALLLLARLNLKRGHDDAAAHALVHALQAMPLILLDIDDDPTYATIVHRGAVRDAIRKARQQLG